MWKEIAVVMKTNLGKLAILAASILLTAACSKSGTVSSDGSSTVTGSIFATKVYPTSEGENWSAIKQGSTFYVKGTSLTIQGTCTRGVDVIKVGESGTGGPFYTETAACQNDGSFTWTKSFTSPIDTTKPLSLVAFDIDDAAISGATDSVSAHVDDVVPPDPVMTNPAASSAMSPDAYNGASEIYTVTGTVSGDAIRIVGGYNTDLTPSGANFQEDVTLTSGQTHHFTYRTFDLAGNGSSTIDIYIAWAPSISLLVAGNISGAATTDVGNATGFTYEPSATQFATGTTTSTTTTQLLDFGFNFVTNSARQ